MRELLNQKINLILFYIRNGEIEKSKEVASEMIKDDPEAPFGYMLMAVHYFRLQQAEDAFLWVDEMLQRAPEDEFVLMTAASLFEEFPYDGTMTKRRELIEIGLRLYPENSYFHAEHALLHSDDIEQASKSFQEAIRLKPHDDVYLGNYAIFLYQTKKLKEAEKYEELALQANPENRNNLVDFAWISFQRRKYKRAQTLIDQAMRLDPSDPNIRECYKKIYPTKNILVRAKTELNHILLRCWAYPAIKLHDLFKQSIHFRLLAIIVMLMELGGLFALLGKNFFFIIGGYILLLLLSKNTTKSMLKTAGLTDAEEEAMKSSSKLTQEAALLEMKKELSINKVNPEANTHTLSASELEEQLATIWNSDNIEAIRKQTEANATISPLEPHQEKPLFLTNTGTTSEASDDKKETTPIVWEKEYKNWPAIILVFVMVLGFAVRHVPAAIEKAKQPKPISTEVRESVDKAAEKQRLEEDKATVKDNLPVVTHFTQSIRDGSLADTLPALVSRDYEPIIREKINHPLLGQLANARAEKVNNIGITSYFLLVNDQENVKAIVVVIFGKIKRINAEGWSDSVKDKEDLQKWLTSVEENGKNIEEMTKQ